MTEKPLPKGIMNIEGGWYQNTDGYTFYPLDPEKFKPTPMSQSCSNDRCTTTYEEPTSTREPVNQDDYLTIFDDIVGYDELKLEFAKTLMSSSPTGILLVGPPGCGKSEFLRKINTAFPDHSLLIDGSYSSKAGIFENLYNSRPRFVLLDEIDKLSGQDQQALLNLMESGRLTKTTKSESYDIQLDAWVFATANSKEDVLDPLFDRFERYFLSEYTDEEFSAIAVKRLKQEGIQNEELALYIANAVLRGLIGKA